jgi:L-lactate dehydrogenase complex protein LldG
MSARDNILGRLRAAQKPFTDVPAIETRHLMRPMTAHTADDLRVAFLESARKLNVRTLHTHDPEAALQYVLEVIGDDPQILSWDVNAIPLRGLDAALAGKGITVAPPRSDNVRVGVTGVEFALASTGSLVVSATKGHNRAVSLLPTVHIAILNSQQILPHFEAYIEHAKANVDTWRKTENHVIITGASRTADIAMELVNGAHGPAELHVVVVDG